MTTDINVDGSMVARIELPWAGSGRESVVKKDVQVGLFKGFLLTQPVRQQQDEEFASSLSNKTVFSMAQNEELRSWKSDSDGNKWLLLGRRGSVAGIPQLGFEWEINGDVGMLVLPESRECLLFFDFFWL